MGKNHTYRALLSLLLVALSGLCTLPAAAQVSKGVFRFSIDTDILSIAGIELERENGTESELTVYGIGPNQHGGARAQLGASLGSTPLGFGFAYGVGQKVLLGMRMGLGLDVISPDGAEENTRLLALSLMPGLTFVPLGARAKMFVSMSPILQFDRVKVDEDKARTLLGGFGVGIGTLIFMARSVSVDLGFHFEGRFGNYEDFNGVETDLRDLRGLVRLGLSLWR